MSGIATATGIAGSTIIAGVGAAASAGSAIFSAVKAGSKANGSGAETEVGNADSTAMSARSQLLDTVGGSAGAPLSPGQVGNNDKTLFGN